jgi:hypothetical protein
MAEDRVLLIVSCGMAVGPPYWQTVDVYESDECPWDGYIWCDREEFEECGFPHIHCPRCTQELEEDCHYEVVDPADVDLKDLAEAKEWTEYHNVYAKADLGDGPRWFQESWEWETGGRVFVSRAGAKFPPTRPIERRVGGDFPSD